jgi:hypothetical protein
VRSWTSWRWGSRLYDVSNRRQVLANNTTSSEVRKLLYQKQFIQALTPGMVDCVGESHYKRCRWSGDTEHDMMWHGSMLSERGCSADVACNSLPREFDPRRIRICEPRDWRTLNTWGSLKRQCFSCPSIKAYRSRGLAPLILNFGIRWRWVINFKTRPFYFRQRDSWYRVNRGWLGPRDRMGILEKQNISCTFRELNPESFSP